MSWHLRMIHHWILKTVHKGDFTHIHSITIWILWYRCCSYPANKDQQLVRSRKLQSVCQTELLKNWPRHGNKNNTELWTFLMITQWTFDYQFQHESPLWSLMKHFCELFPEKIFTFHESSELDYFRKWAATGHGIGDLEVSINVHHRGDRGTNLYSTSPKNRNPKRYLVFLN